MSHIKHPLRDLAILIRANLWLIPAIAALIAAVFYFITPPPLMSATMATNARDGDYAMFAGKLRENLKKQGFELELVSSAGSHNSPEYLLGTDEVDIALVQSGQERQLETGQARQLQTLGAVYQGPLWLFRRSNMHIDQLNGLLRLRLAIGNNSSGTRAVTEVILQANDITPRHYLITWGACGGGTAVDDPLAGKLDAALIAGPAENPVIQKLADSDQLCLVNSRRSAAYEARLSSPKRVEVDEGPLNLPRNVPERSTSILLPVATLVINGHFYLVLILLVLEATRKMMKDGGLLDKFGAFPSAKPHTLHLHEDIERYYKSGLPLLQRYLPFRTAFLADRHIVLLIPFTAIFAPLMKSIGPLHRWRIRACIHRQYRCIRDVDCKLDNGTDVGQLRSEIERLEKLGSGLNAAEVPFSYYHELYELHLYLDFVTKRLRGLQEYQATQVEAGNLG